jgi:guanine deaminase
MLMIAGKVMMDRNAPDGVTDTPQSGYDDSKALIEEWHGKGRQNYAITPRFAITSSPEQMEMAEALVREFPDCHMQTHLSENHDEIAFTQELYPWSKDYTDIYDHYGLLGKKSLFGHCIHLSEREADALSESGSVAVFCPTSNLFLGSGLFDYQRYRKRDRRLRIASATDVGGGTNYSMLRTMDEGYKVIALNGEKLNPLASFWQITRGNAEALSIGDRVGSLEVGSDADIVVLDPRATPAMRLRMDRTGTLAEELFLLQTLGDDRAAVEVYVAGRAAKSPLGEE